MNTRTLPPAEWSRLTGDGWRAMLPHVRPDDVEIVVVEDDGRIVASWAVMRVVHLEGLWIDPDYRGRVGVARRLFVATLAAARRWTSGWAMTGAASDDVRAMLTKVGALPVPMDSYVMPIGAEEPCQQPSLVP